MMHPGDFIVWQGHIGMIEKVDKKNGIVTTLQGNGKREGYNEHTYLRKSYTIADLQNRKYLGYIDNSELSNNKIPEIIKLIELKKQSLDSILDVKF